MASALGAAEWYVRRPVAASLPSSSQENIYKNRDFRIAADAARVIPRILDCAQVLQFRQRDLKAALPDGLTILRGRFFQLEDWSEEDMLKVPTTRISFQQAASGSHESYVEKEERHTRSENLGIAID